MSEKSQRLLVRGKAAAKADDKEEAKFYLEWVLRLRASSNQQRSEAWFYLGAISESSEEQKECFTNALSFNPRNARIKKALAIATGKLDKDNVIDPENIAEQIPNMRSKLIQPQDQICPNCKGKMVFSPDGEELICEYCAVKKTRMKNSPTEQDFILNMATIKGHGKPVVTQVIECHRCGATFIHEPVDLAFTCPYCQTVYTKVEFSTAEIVSPTAIVPFNLNKKKVRKILMTAFEQEKIDRPFIKTIHGEYFPVWTFDLSGDMNWKALKQSSTSDDWVPINRNKLINFDDLIVPGSDKIDKYFAKFVRNMNTAQAENYNSDLLADWVAETYTVTLSQAALEARETAIRNSYQTIENSQIITIKDLYVNPANLYVDSFKLTLVPIWFGDYTAELKSFRFIVNGATGEFEYEKPRSSVEKIRDWLLGKN